MNIQLFERILRTVEYLRPGSRQSLEGERFIKLADTSDIVLQEREYLNSFRIERIFRDSNIVWVVIDTSVGRRLLFSGPKLDISADINIRLARPSEFLFFNNYFDLYPTGDLSTIVDIVGSGSRSLEGYAGHSYEQIFQLFDMIYVVEDEIVNNSCVSRIITGLYIRNSRLHKGEHDNELFSKIKAGDWLDCNFEQAKMLSAFHLPGPLHFVILYWLLEGFFFHYSVKSLYDILSPKVAEDDFYKLLEDQLEWRPKEIFAFSKLVLECVPDDKIAVICKNVSTPEEFSSVKAENRADFLAKKIYSFRNKIVHSRHKEKRASPSDIKKFSCAAYDVAQALFTNQSAAGATICTCGQSSD